MMIWNVTVEQSALGKQPVYLLDKCNRGPNVLKNLTCTYDVEDLMVVVDFKEVCPLNFLSSCTIGPRCGHDSRININAAIGYAQRREALS